MCVRLLRWAWKQVCPTPLAKFLLVRLADYANDVGECWPSYNRLAKDCGIDPRSAKRVIQGLEKTGLVRIARHGTRVNRYLLASDAMSPAASDPTPPAKNGASDAMSPVLVTPVHVASDTMSPKPLYNPHKNPHPVLRTARRSRAAAPDDLLEKGKALLGSAKRGLIRQMLLRHGPDPVRNALDAVERKQPADPAAYFAACCEQPALSASEPHDRLWYPGPSGPPPQFLCPPDEDEPP